jgi:hypothetical protein
MLRRALLTFLGVAALAAPTAATAAETVVEGNARFQVITPTLIRLEYAEDGRFEDRPTTTAIDRDAGPVDVQSTVEGDQRVVRTSHLELRYTRGSGAFTPLNLTVEVRRGDDTVTARPRFGLPTPVEPPKPDPAIVYQAAMPDPLAAPRTKGNLGGWHRGMDQAVGAVALHDGLLSRDGWYLLDDSQTALLVDESPGWAARDRTLPYQDGYFFGYGLDLRRGLADFRALSGPPAFPPRKALGNWFSRWSTWDDAHHRKELLPAFRRERVPLDVLVLDTNARAPKAWNGTQWDTRLFPDPKAFLAWAHGEGLDVALNQHPTISSDDPQRAQVEAASGGLLLEPQPGSQIRCRFFTADPFNTCGHFDFARRRHADAWFGAYEHFERDGVDFWWFDWCCEDAAVDAPGLGPDAWINHLYAQRSEARGKRWPALSRVGSSREAYTHPGPGIWAEHRNAIHFTGDSFDRWEVLDFQTRFTVAEGNVGIPWVSHDIGSFHGGTLPDDLYVRWIQLGAFQPINRFHSSGDGGKRLPWEYQGRARETAARFMRLRGELVPYLYTLAREAYDTGLPLTRGMYLRYPQFDEAYEHDRQYLLGDDVLVAPVGRAGDPAVKRVWFPPGVWADFFTGERFEGPAVRDVSVPLERMPVYVRAGGIVPMQHAPRRAGTEPPETLVLRVQAGADGAFELYEDAGDGLAYRDGAFARTPLRWDEAARTLTVGAPRGTFAGQRERRRYELRIAGVGRPSAVEVGGAPLPASAWSYDEATRTVTADAGERATGTSLAVRLAG